MGRVRSAALAATLMLFGCTTYAPNELPEGAELREPHPSTALLGVWASMLPRNATLSLELNGTVVATLREEEAVALELIPNTQNRLISRVSTGATTRQWINVHNGNSHLFFDMYMPFGGNGLEQLKLNKTQASAVFAQYPEVTPSVAMSDIAVYPQALKAAAKTCIEGNDLAACEQTLAKIPERLQSVELVNEVASLRATEDRRALKVAALEASMSPETLRDRYMLALTELLKAQRYADSLELFAKLDDLDVQRDPSLDFYYGKALLETGQYQAAIERLYRYINAQGQGARHYSAALELINVAEAEL